MKSNTTVSAPVIAHEQARLRTDCLTRSREAYANGDGAAAHELSEAGKRHGASMEKYNDQARDYIFRANNAHLPSDTINLHGLYVEEAEEILEKRIDAARGRGEGYLNVIVGKGNHSTGGVRKIGPAVMELCRKRGLKVEEEEGNWGKLIVTLGEGGAGHSGAGGQSYGRYGKQQQQQQQQEPPNELGGLAKKAAPKIIKKLQGCCIIC
ncbi:Smr-domain-containing protein [Choiromyces venosus 120613-1]|uniref:Smr-domain-containing protein n=1 Tax=Choiromyces venosus 120613-1 TaxID=1336337 RepID=A0A3N4J9B4_9PEZI|nr:Smr-domain-containing protein [Choiromyces venosus 120613-1]